MSKIKVNTIEAQSGSTITIPTGQTLTVTDGLATSSLPTVPVSKGGTGLTSLGSAGQVVQVNSGGNALEFATASAGGILQLKSANEPNKVTTNSSSFTALTNLSVTITPASTSNKILILANVHGSGLNGSNAGGAVAIYRNGSILSGANGNTSGNRTRCMGQLASGNGSEEWIVNGNATIFLDNPASTSAQTYQLYFRNEDNNNSILNAGYNDPDQSDRVRTASNITVMEIGSTIL